MGGWAACNLAEEVLLDDVVLRMVAVRGVGALGRWDRYGALGVCKVGRVAPRDDAVLTDQVEFVVPDRGVARVARDHDGVSVEPLKEAPLHGDVLGAAVGPVRAAGPAGQPEGVEFA